MRIKDNARKVTRKLLRRKTNYELITKTDKEMKINQIILPNLAKIMHECHLAVGSARISEF